MDVFAALDMLVRSTEERSFSAAARQLGLTPAAVSKQIARLERELGVQLVVRSTRSLALTEAGTRLVANAGPGLTQLHAALASANQRHSAIGGVLRVSLAAAFGRQHVLPLMGPFLAAHPALKLDWHFENRQVDLIAEGFDAGIAGGVDLAGGLVARTLAPLHLVMVAAPAYLLQCGLPEPKAPNDLAAFDALVLRSASTRRSRPWSLQNRRQKATIEPKARLWLSDPEALSDAALAGYGVALAGLPHVLPHLEAGTLVRLLPQWWSDGGAISVYYSPSRLMPAKTRAFVDHITSAMSAQGLAKRLTAGVATR